MTLAAIYEVPNNVVELFKNGEESYRIIDHDQEADNIQAMQMFIESVGIPEEMIEINDGTQIIITNGSERLQIDSGGLGDFFSHGFDVTKL